MSLLAAPVSTPPLIESDSLTSDEFLRCWEEMPAVRHAELIDGIVYMPSPVSNWHSKYESFLNCWLGIYCIATPGCQPSMEGTWLMAEGKKPSAGRSVADSSGVWRPGGQQGHFFAGAPELVVEVAATSYSRDFGTNEAAVRAGGRPRVHHCRPSR